MRLSFVCIISLCYLHSFGQVSDNSLLSVMFYNVENLFDCEDDSLKYDEEFTPESNKRWNHYRLRQKLNSISKVILSANQWQPPDIIGLCEVENSNVLKQLIYETGLRSLRYKYIHFESPDKRGIDVALLYRQDKVKVIKSSPVNISRPDNNFYTRDALYTHLCFNNRDSIHVIVNHWPSKRGGTLASEPKRVHASNCVSSLLDSIKSIDRNCHCILMGDFNADTEAQSLKQLIAGHQLIVPKLLETNHKGVTGTYKYKGQWSQIDHILISNTLNDKYSSNLKIIDLPFLVEEDRSYYGVKPYRTYIGPRYNGGTSDHLPTLLIISENRTDSLVLD